LTFAFGYCKLITTSNKYNHSDEKESKLGCFIERLWLVKRVKFKKVENGLGGKNIDT